jgi:ATP-binding protein involved in chromosome partitioning
MSANLQDRIADALSHVRNNRIGANVLEAEMVSDIATTTDGRVRLTLFLSPEDNATVVREVRQALQLVEGVTDVRVDVKDASQANTTPRRAQQPPAKPVAAPAATKPAASRALPVM